ncbi:MAG: hypothetical protein J6J30_02535 [Clostridia bacterium]|jgi:hypothetical protein|nr:hypothetical protein [Clostridia bacterium]MEE1074401.1 hypothetical protein [Acutalibacteraceae bacterium]
MTPEKEWLRFLKSGRVADYLNYVNSCKENMISGGTTDTVHNRGLGNKGNERRGE